MKKTPQKQSKDLDYNDFELKPLYLTTPPLTKKALKSMSLLDEFEQLIKLAENCGLNDDFFQIHHNLIQSLADKLELPPAETVMLCPFISSCNEIISESDIKNYFLCSPITFMRKAQALKTLVRRRYIVRRGCNYQLSERAKKAFCENQSLPVTKATNLTAAELMKQFTIYVSDVGRNNVIDEEEMHEETMTLLNENPQLAIARNITGLRVPNPDTVYLLYFCKRLVIDHQAQVPLGQLEFLSIEAYLDEFPVLMTDGTHPFLKEGLLMVAGQDGFMSSNVYQLTEKAKALFLSEYDLPKVTDDAEEEEHSHTINCNDIKPKSLYYSQEDQGQIETLHHLLEERQLQAIRERLEKANLRKGFNCLFYGAPGTGKTETALQLARMTGRDIMQVDISSIRDKWYGETEKIVQSIFASYSERVKKSERIPILLINEADAVLSVRTGLGGNNPTLEKTENAIQNILLQAMEDIDGIMIATTNLTCNLDSAFDRRFLYKVEFHQPSVEAKTHIWRSFIPELSEADASSLAHSYDFSGGQIENIARKVMVDHLLFGGKPELKHIEELCSKEQIAGRKSNSRRPIGFSS